MSKSKSAAAPETEQENIKVVIRLRPLSKDEKTNQNSTSVDIVTMDRKLREVRVRNPAAASAAELPRTFTMDHVFDESLPQQLVYEETCQPIVANIISGYNGTVFAYGQTGTGKTFTMEGIDKPPELKGMLPRSFDQIFDHINSSSSGAEFLVRASFLEIYNDNILDLLANGKDGLELKEDPDRGVYVKDLKLCAVKSVAEINALAVLGRKSRKVGATLMNAGSSRSHCLFCIMVETSEMGPDGENHIRAGKLNMVDLAGSERQGKTGAEGVRLKEAAKINLALSALGNVIAALTSAKSVGFVPYRDSKLTRLLQDSLGGNTKTVMIANIGPADYNYEETINTLRFAMRAKSIKNKPKINEDPKDAQLRVFQDEIAALRAALAAEEAISQGLPPPAGYDPALLARMGVTSSGGSSAAPRQALPPRKVIVEKIVEKRIGVTQEERDRLLADTEQMKKNLEEKQRKKEEESRQIKDIINAKHTEIKNEVTATENEIQVKRETKKEMLARLQEMENKIAHGNKELDQAQKAKLAIQRKQLEIADEERKAQVALEARLAIEDEQDILRKQSEDLDTELQIKSTKLEKLQSKYHEIKQEAEDIQAENQREREQLLETIRELTRHIQLKDFILDNYVPREETEKIENRAYWNEDHDSWLLHPTNYHALNTNILRPGSAKPGCRRPTSDWSIAHSMRQLDSHQMMQMGMQGHHEQVHSYNARFKAENILDLELSMPERTTQDYSDGSQQQQQQEIMQQHQPMMMAGGGGGGYQDASYEMALAQQHQQQHQQRQMWEPQMQQQASYRR